MHFVWMVIVGFVVGLIARAVLPGTQSLGMILTAVLGIVGSLVAGFVGQALGWYQPGEAAGFIGSIVGAIVVLFVYGKVANSRAARRGGEGLRQVLRDGPWREPTARAAQAATLGNPASAIASSASS